MILLLCPLLPINPRIPSQLTVHKFKIINSEQEQGIWRRYGEEQQQQLLRLC